MLLKKRGRRDPGRDFCEIKIYLMIFDRIKMVAVF